MTATNYDACEAHVLVSEGGYTNNPHDPGGPTNWGITIFDARLYWKHDATAEDVRAMPKTVAQDIYRKKYWNALDCDDVPSGLDYTLFDYGVNSGISRAGLVLRRSIGLPANDWHITPEVLAAVSKHDIAALINQINDERLHFLQGLRIWPTFGRGWTARIAGERATSLKMVAGTAPAPPPPNPEIQAAGKAVDHTSNLFSHLAYGSWAAIRDVAHIGEIQ